MDPITARLVFLLLNSVADAAIAAVSKRVQLPPESENELKQAITPIIVQHVTSTHAAFNSMVVEQDPETGRNINFHAALSTALHHLETGAVDIAKTVIGDALGLPDNPQLPLTSEQTPVPIDPTTETPANG